MPDAPAELTADRITDTLEGVPWRGASDGTLQTLLDARGVEVSRGRIRDFCDALVADGILELDGQKGESKRYRLVEGR